MGNRGIDRHRLVWPYTIIQLSLQIISAGFDTELGFNIASPNLLPVHVDVQLVTSTFILFLFLGAGPSLGTRLSKVGYIAYMHHALLHITPARG